MADDPSPVALEAAFDGLTDELIGLAARVVRELRRDSEAAILELRSRATELEVKLLARTADARERLALLEAEFAALRERLGEAERSAVRPESRVVQ
jgi:hypothetical protein